MKPIAKVTISAVLAGALLASLFALVPASVANAQINIDGMPARATLGTPFTLTMNETVAVAGSDISVTFYNITEDSRCPSDVTCIWAGQVTADVGLKQNSTDLGRFRLTLGAGSNTSKAEQAVGQYSIKLTKVDPYPVSTKHIQPSEYVATLVLSKQGGMTARSAILMAVANSTQSPGVYSMISSWSYERETGVMIIVIRDNSSALARSVLKFVPSQADCLKDGMFECVDGQVSSVTGSGPIKEGDTVHFEIDSAKQHVYVSLKSPMDGSESSGQATQYALDVHKFREFSKPYAPDGNSTTVTLHVGERDGPLLVQAIYPDRVEGLNYPEYPVAMDKGLPITLKIGEKASNGCTVSLTLIKIEDGSATFLKKVEENRPCPICWVQRDLMSGWP